MTTTVRARATRKPWWRRPWTVPLLAVSVLFVLVSLPPYLQPDPAQARTPLRPGVDWHFPLLAVHVIFGAIALLTVCFQIWPAMRAWSLPVHRWLGRVYVFGGVLPAGLTALVVGALSERGPLTMAGNLLGGIAWLATTATAYLAARRRRFRVHRRWMIRSFALTVSIMLDRVLAVPLLHVLEPRTAHAITTWASFLTCVLVAEWWLRRSGHTPPR
ncbi:DUF2306 domain-containing protein [Crossiella sp. CA198]|uniref:DUF2306 domain-containing protein n=1 Tax=Crossiella sp. CA198 TaxID=3455607 RepID=UPI003F8D1A8A